MWQTFPNALIRVYKHHTKQVYCVWLMTFQAHDSPSTYRASAPWLYDTPPLLFYVWYTGVLLRVFWVVASKALRISNYCDQSALIWCNIFKRFTLLQVVVKIAWVVVKIARVVVKIARVVVKMWSLSGSKRRLSGGCRQPTPASVHGQKPIDTRARIVYRV